MTVLHYIPDSSEKSLSHIFLREMLKACDTKLIVHLMANVVTDDLAQNSNVKFHAISPLKWLSVEGHRQFCKIMAEVKPDIIHIHSFWDVSAWLVFMWAKKNRIPVVVSTYKQLMRWNFSKRYLCVKLPKYIFMQRVMLKTASAIHVVTEQEKDLMEKVSWHPLIKSSIPLNGKIVLVKYASDSGEGADYCRLAEQLTSLYRKVIDSNPFCLMSVFDRETEGELLALGTSLLSNVPEENIYMDIDKLKVDVANLTDERWRRIQLHACNQGVLQPVVLAYRSVMPKGELLNIDKVERFGKNADLPFLETMRAKEKVARMKQLATDYANYETERKICVMLINVRYLIRRKQLTRRNLADLYTVLRFEQYNDYMLEVMLDEIGLLKFASRMFYIIHKSLFLENGYIPIKTINDRDTKSIIKKLFKSNMQ